MREALAAALVKHEADRPVFDQLFDEAFPLVGGAEEGRRRRRARGAGGGRVPTGAGRGAGDGGRSRLRDEREERRERATHGHAREASPGAEARQAREVSGRESRAARARRLLALPFRELTSRDVEEARELVRELGRRLRGRLARRERRARRGRLDFRRTIRRSMSTAGVPIRPGFRARRPGRPDLVALCDLSGSVAAASELLLGLIAPAADHFRRVHLFAYVDRLCPVSIEHGHVAPGGPLDLHARSDFGRVLVEVWEGHRARLTRSTLLLVLGDARNNRLHHAPTCCARSRTASSASCGSCPSRGRAGTRATACSGSTRRPARRWWSASIWGRWCERCARRCRRMPHRSESPLPPRAR